MRMSKNRSPPNRRSQSRIDRSLRHAENKSGAGARGVRCWKPQKHASSESAANQSSQQEVVSGAQGCTGICCLMGGRGLRGRVSHGQSESSMNPRLTAILPSCSSPAAAIPAMVARWCLVRIFCTVTALESTIPSEHAQNNYARRQLNNFNDGMWEEKRVHRAALPCRPDAGNVHMGDPLHAARSPRVSVASRNRPRVILPSSRRPGKRSAPRCLRALRVLRVLRVLPANTSPPTEHARAIAAPCSRLELDCREPPPMKRPI